MAGVPVSPVGQGPVTQPDTNPVDQKTGQSATWLIQLLNDLRTGVIKVANSGTTAQRPVDPLLGELYYDTSVISSGSIGTYFFCDTIRDANTSTPAHWTALGPGSGGGVTSITATLPITVTPSPITATGDIEHAVTAVTPGTYGASPKIPQFTVDQWGHITDAQERDACRCVTDIVPPSMYQFPSNNVLGFDITQDDTIIGPYARVTVVSTLGDGVTALYSGGYSGQGSGDGIYNPVDDRIYFVTRKYTTLISPGVFDLTTWHNMFVKWNWHTLSIELEVELPAGWCVPPGPEGGSVCGISPATLVDLGDNTGWLFNGDTSEMNAYELGGLSIIYAAAPGDAFVDNYFTGFNTISGADRVVILQTNPAGDLNMVQVTGPAAADFVDLGTIMAAGNPYFPVIAETGDTRRFWLPSKNLLFLYTSGTFAVAQPLADIFDLSLGPVTGGHVILINSILGVLQLTRPHWDTFLERVYALDASGGEAQITKAGYISRVFGAGGDYDTGFPLGGSLFMWSLTFTGGGEFIPATNSNANIADKTYTTTNTTAGGDTWDFGPDKTIAVMRRFLGFPDPATVTF